MKNSTYKSDAMWENVPLDVCPAKTHQPAQFNSLIESSLGTFCTAKYQTCLQNSSKDRPGWWDSLWAHQCKGTFSRPAQMDCTKQDSHKCDIQKIVKRCCFWTKELCCDYPLEQYYSNVTWCCVSDETLAFSVLCMCMLGWVVSCVCACACVCVHVCVHAIYIIFCICSRK